MNIFFVVLGIFAGLTVLFAVAALILFFCIFTRDKNPLKNSKLESYEPYKKAVAEGEKFWDSLNPETFFIKNGKTELKCEFYFCGSDKSVVLPHGYHSDCYSRSPDAEFYVKRGFNVLIYDQRAHGGSGGKFLTMGFMEKEDLLCCVSYLKKKTGGSSALFVDGISMGAATALLAAAKTGDLTGVIADCGYSSAYELFSYQLKRFYRFFPFPLLNFLNMWCRIIAKFNLRDASPLKYAHKIAAPVLLIHGGKDDFVPKYMADKIFAALRCKKDLCISEKSGHALSRIEERERCEKKIGEFLDEALTDRMRSEL